VASLSQGRTAAAQCGLFTYKSVPVIFEPPCMFIHISQEMPTIIKKRTPTTHMNTPTRELQYTAQELDPYGLNIRYRDVFMHINTYNIDSGTSVNCIRGDVSITLPVTSTILYLWLPLFLSILFLTLGM